MRDLRDPWQTVPADAPERPDWDMVQIGLIVADLHRGSPDPRAQALVATLKRITEEVVQAYRRRCSEP